MKIVVILSVAQLEQQVFSAQLEISHMLNGTTPENQHRKRGPMWVGKNFLQNKWMVP